MAYANGRAPESALIYADGIHIAPSVGRRFLDFQTWAARQGRSIHVPRLGGYRDYDEQGDLWKASNGKGTGGSSVKIALPGYSTHGNYDAGRVDIVGASGYSYTKAELAWIVANAGRFGLVREFGTSDPNHFVASGTYASASTGKTETVSTYHDDITGDPMKRWTFWRNPETGTVYVLTGRELIALTKDDYIKLRNIFILMSQREPQGGWVVPADFNDANAFFNLDAYGINLLGALAPVRQ